MPAPSGMLGRQECLSSFDCLTGKNACPPANAWQAGMPVLLRLLDRQERLSSRMCWITQHPPNVLFYTPGGYRLHNIDILYRHKPLAPRR